MVRSAVVTCDIIYRRLTPSVSLSLFAESKFECEAEQRCQLQWPATTNCTKRNALHAAAAAERRVYGEIFSHSTEKTDNRRKTAQQFVSDRVNANAHTRSEPGCEQSLLIPQRHLELRSARQRSSQARTHPVRTITSNKHITVSDRKGQCCDCLTLFSHSSYKTELCRPYEEAGECKYGDKCQFAHGFHELRNLQRHPKYKTELCRTFHSVGFCPYGAR